MARTDLPDHLWYIRVSLTLFLLMAFLPNSFSCSESWTVPVSLKDRVNNQEDFIGTNDFLNLRYGKNWQYDDNKYIEISKVGKSDDWSFPIEIKILQAPDISEVLEVDVMLEMKMKYEDKGYVKKIESGKSYLIIRDRIIKAKIFRKTMQSLKTRVNMRSKGRVVVIFTYRQEKTNLVTKRIVDISSEMEYIIMHCGGTYLVD